MSAASARRHHDDPGVPRGALIAVGLLLATVIALVALVRLTGVGHERVPDAAAVDVREFRFEDRPDGSIAILATERRQVATVEPGTNGFLRSTMRGMARERHRQGLGDDVPFRLIGRADGRLTLEDPATGRRIDLESFGPMNAAVFAQLMTTSKETP